MRVKVSPSGFPPGTGGFTKAWRFHEDRSFPLAALPPQARLAAIHPTPGEETGRGNTPRHRAAIRNDGGRMRGLGFLEGVGWEGGAGGEGCVARES